MAYCTTAWVKSLVDIKSPGDDNLIDSLIDAAQQAIDGYCHRSFEASADTTRYIDAVGDHVRGRVLHLDDIGELAAVTTITNGDGVEVTSGEYVLVPRNKTPYTAIRLLGSSGKTWTYSTDWEDAISITGRWAYSSSAPAIIQEACASLAAFYYRQKDAPFTDVTAVEVGVVVRPVGIPTHIKAMLDKGYVKP